MLKTRDIYTMARRQYRISLRLNLMQPGAIEARDAALLMLRAVVGKWDDCRPNLTHTARWHGTPNGRNSCARWHVNAACTVWMKAH